MLPDRLLRRLFSSVPEQDRHFRSALTQVLHTGLRQCGAIGLVAALLYVGLSVFGLGYDLAWTYDAIVQGGLEHQIVVAGTLIVAALSVIGLILSQRQCSLRTGRLFGWTAVLLAAAVATFEGAVRGVFSTEYVILAYLLIVAIIPFRPAQVVGIGGSIAVVVYLLGPSGPAWSGTFAISGGMAKHLAFLGGGAVLVTGAGIALYLRHYTFGTTQASLQKSRDLLRRTQKVAGIGGWEYDPDTDTVEGTEELYEILDLPNGTRFELERFFQFFLSPSRSDVRTALEGSLRDGDAFDLEASLRTATDSWRQVRLRGTAEKADGASPRLTGILQDITERQAMEQRIREQERLLRSITENVSDGIYRLVPGEGLIYANRAFARLFGYDDVAALLSLDPDAFYADPDQHTNPLHLTEEAVAQGHEVTFRRKDGSTFVGLLGGTVVRDDDGTVQHIDGVVTDITDLKEREQLLKGERDRFERLFETLLDQDDPTP